MTDYNDGKWHGWNSGECPVHPDSVVQAMAEDGSRYEDDAEFFNWNKAENGIVAFRVVKPFREPRERWVMGTRAYDSLADAQRVASSLGVIPPEIIHFREVLE